MLHLCMALLAQTIGFIKNHLLHNNGKYQTLPRQYLDTSVLKQHVIIAVKLTATDIFNTQNDDWCMDTYAILMNKYHSYDRRGITLRVQYQFQPKKSKYKGKAVSKAEMNRL